MRYATGHAKAEGAGLLTILAYDGHGVANETSGSTVLQVEGYKLVGL